MRTLVLALLAAGASLPAAAQETPPGPSHTQDIRSETASSDVHDVAGWVIASNDHHGLPFLIVDKRAATVFAFNRLGQPTGTTPVLLGLATGDDSVPGIGQRRLATIKPAERTTPAGRFQAVLGHDFDQDILWIDYDSALSLHRVITGNPKDRRAARLASPSPLDNRISYGCINVPAAFYDTMVVPAFTGTVGIVYILPETRPLEDVFPALRKR